MLAYEAVSFPGATPPEGAEEIDRVEHPILGTVIYYKSPKSSTIYYATKSGLEFASRMEEAIRQKKTKK